MADAIAELRSALGDRFAIERLLGQGGMGAVYLARDRQLDRPVALKVLPAEFAAQHDLRERFLRETRTAASFSHPNIVPVFSVEERPTLLAYTMGYVEGESVAEMVARSGPLSVREVVRLLQDIAYALAYAHGRGVIHRDIKPDNIMIERATGRALLMDFGISRSLHAAPAPAPGSTRAGLTRVGEVVGTPEYMSPEQASGDTLDGRSDLYSLGLVAWFALTGASAMAGESTAKVLVKQLTEMVPPVATLRADVPPLLADVIERCLAKAPEERVANAEALVEALDVDALRGVEIPLPVRLFAGELTQVSVVFLGALVFAPVLLALLRKAYVGNIDIILPMVLFAAIVWGRVAQTVQRARLLVRRGFDVPVLMNGFAALRNEQDAERQQLRANPLITAKRRKQVIFLSVMFLFTFAMREYVFYFMRTQTKPDWYVVSRPGAIILYSAYTMRGLALVGLLRSPLRANLGERLWHWTWGAAPGRLALRLMTVGVPRPSVSTTIPPTRPLTAPPRQPTPAPVAAAAVAPTRTLEDRVTALEQWRASRGE
jgi:serine/threonine-protein kinase